MPNMKGKKNTTKATSLKETPLPKTVVPSIFNARKVVEPTVPKSLSEIEQSSLSHDDKETDWDSLLHLKIDVR